jgi:hypothetical protein
MKKPLFPTFKCQTCANITLKDTQIAQQFLQECQFYAMHIRACSAHTSIVERLQLTDFVLDSCQFFHCVFSELLMNRVVIRNCTFYECLFSKGLTDALTSSQITFENCTFIDTDVAFFSNQNLILADLKFIRCSFIQTRSDRPSFQRVLDLPITLETFYDRRPQLDNSAERQAADLSPRQVAQNTSSSRSQASKGNETSAADPNAPFHEGRFGNLEIDPH